MRRIAAALALAAALAGASCSPTDSGVTVQPASGGGEVTEPGGSDDTAAPTLPDSTAAPTTTTTIPPGPPEQAAPVVGECRGPVSRAVIDPATDLRPTVPCDQPHGFETFFVGELPDGPWPGEGSGEAFGFIDEQCAPALTTYLAVPADPVPVVPDRVNGYAFFVPNENDWARGQRWFRCDAFVQPLGDTEETTIAGTLAGVYGAPLPPAYRVCETPERTTLGCDQPHLAEWLALVEVPELEAYPAPTGDAVLVSRCGTAVQQALGATAPRPDLNIGYALPDQVAWELDPANRRAVCVAAATDGRTLVGTLAGIGDAGPLPGAPPAAA